MSFYKRLYILSDYIMLMCFEFDIINDVFPSLVIDTIRAEYRTDVTCESFDCHSLVPLGSTY